ncbi:MAG: hypothetical protein AB8F78_09595 [Saprospiraceae bacterium]
MASFLLRLSICLLIFPLSLAIHAQDSRAFENKFFIDARAGAFLYDIDAGILNTQILLAAGWRATKHHGIGLSLRNESAYGSYNGNSMTGLGLDYRFDWSKSVVAKIGFGKVLKADDSSDYTRGVYIGGGTYTSFSADYVFRGGFTLGVWATAIQNIRFDNYYYNTDFGISSEEEYLYGSKINEKFSCFGIAIGYSWPRRKRLSREK